MYTFSFSSFFHLVVIVSVALCSALNSCEDRLIWSHGSNTTLCEKIVCDVAGTNPSAAGLLSSGSPAAPAYPLSLETKARRLCACVYVCPVLWFRSGDHRWCCESSVTPFLRSHNCGVFRLFCEVQKTVLLGHSDIAICFFFFFLIRELDWIRHTGLAWNFCWLHANSCIIAIFSLFILFNSALSCTCMYIYRSNCSTLQLYRTTKLLFYTVSSFIFFFRSYKIFFFSHQRTCFCCCDCKILFTCFCDYWQQLLWGDMLFRVFLLHCYFLSFIFVDCPPPFLLSLVLCQ